MKRARRRDETLADACGASIIREDEMNAALKRRVQGQDHIIDALCKFIRLKWGKEQRGKGYQSVTINVGDDGKPY